MCFWFDQPSLNIPWVLCKTYLMLKNLKGECLKILILGKLGLKLVFLKNFASHTHAFYSYFSMLGGFYAKIRLFFSKLWVFVFSFLWEFQSIEAVFRSIEIDSNFFGEPLSILINRKSWIRFFKNWVWLVQTHFSKVFQTFLSLSSNQTWLIINFLSFSSVLFARFSSPKAGKTFIPFLLNLFSCFLHKIMHYLGNFEPMKFLGFLMN